MPHSLPKLYLASSSPRRKQLLEALGLPFQVVSAQVFEAHPSHSSIQQGVLENASRKAIKGLEQVKESTGVVIGADTLVVLEDQVLGKPAGLEDAKSMLSLLSGRTHEVITGVDLRTPNGKFIQFAVSSSVKFRDLSPQDISDYVSTKEPYDKAGSYAIQGLGALFIERIEGSYSNIMGFPIEQFLIELPRLTGIPIRQWFLP